jgi:thiamine pyrophosphokinase
MASETSIHRDRGALSGAESAARRRPSEPDPVRTGEGSHWRLLRPAIRRHPTDPRPPSDAVVIVADGDIAEHELAWLHALAERQDRPRILAADGGAARCLAAGVRPDVVIGDLDSLMPDTCARLAELGIPIEEAPDDKDESDLELCLRQALEDDAVRITILGALGVHRPEHSIANLLLLADPRLDGREVSLIGHGARIFRIGSATGPGHAVIVGEAGDFVSLFPIGGDVGGVVTEGLRFPLRDEALPVGPSRGLSNELDGSTASITSRRGRLLVVHSRPSAAGPDAAPSGAGPI